MNKAKYLMVIVGPTASGKTALSVSLASHFNTEIISADSRQIYQELNIGTAKPTIEEMQSIKHHFIDSLSIHADYNIGKYEQEVMLILQNIFTGKNLAILTGGSGLYVKAVCEGMDNMPDINSSIREELNCIHAEEGIEGLLQELQKADPEYFNIVDKQNPQRVIRAIEIYRATGTPFSQFRTGEVKQRPFHIIKVGISWDREVLYQRIDQRMDVMIQSGLFEEARQLYPFKDKNALQTVGYKEIFDYMDGKYDKEEAIRLLKRNSRRYAKRQLTWFHKDPDIHWFNAPSPEEVISFMEQKLSLLKK